MVQGPLNGHDQVFWLYPELELEKSKYDKEIRVQKWLITVKKFFPLLERTYDIYL